MHNVWNKCNGNEPINQEQERKVFISFHFTLLFFIFHGPNRPQIRSLETFSSIVNSDSTMGGTEFTFKMYPEVEALLHWMAAALKGDH